MQAYVKGAFVPEEQAMVSIAERGFRFGDGVFETIRVKHGVPLYFIRHLRRLQDGLKALQIASPQEDLHEICRKLLQENTLREGILRLSASRGVGSLGYLPTVTEPPTIVIETLPLPNAPTALLKLYLSSYRKPSPDCLPVQHKLMQGVNSTLARMEAAAQHCGEALMLNESGYICEASSANIFWQQGEQIYTPAPSCGPLNGITRQLLCEAWNERLTEGEYTLSALKQADAVILTNAALGAIGAGSLKPADYRWHSETLAKNANSLLMARAEAEIKQQRDRWL